MVKIMYPDKDFNKEDHIGCGERCTKAVSITISIITLLSGAVILYVSIDTLVDPNAKYLEIATFEHVRNLVKAAATLLSVVGGVLIFLGLLGFVAAMTENICMLKTHTWIVLCLLVVQVAGSILVVVYRQKLSKNLEVALYESLILRYDQTGFELDTETWDVAQLSLQCCGVKHPAAEWTTSEWKKHNPSQSVPPSCCVWKDDLPVNIVKCNLAANGSIADPSHQYYHDIPCFDILMDWAKSHTKLLIVVAFAFVGFQLIVVFLSCRLYHDHEGRISK